MTAIIRPQKLTGWVNSNSNDAEYDCLESCGIHRANSIHEADVVLFVGGMDVNPALYGEEPLKFTTYSLPTDRRDTVGWRRAKDKFKVGICRGGQFLNVMNGGKLWQHVDGHDRYHDLTDAFTNEKVHVSSTHHQQFRPNGRHAVTVATARESKFKMSDGQTWALNEAKDDPINNYFKQDFEVLYYPNTRSLCFQPHPEYSDAPATRNYFEKVLWRALEGKYVKEPRKKEG